MKEYTDLRNRTHKVIERIRDDMGKRKNAEQQEYTEREIIEALFRIFEPENETV